MTAVDPLPPSEVFRTIRRARDERRRIVPLFGAGISVDAGIPHSVLLADYVIAVQGVAKQYGWQIHEFVSKWRWPNRNDTWEDWYSAQLDAPSREHEQYPAVVLREKFESLARELYKLSLMHEIRTVAPLTARICEELLALKPISIPDEALRSARTDYRSLLTIATNNDANLIDAFFDHFIRGRSPSTTHQFVAFLSRLLNIDLILTTNFDSLIETALRNEGLRPTVYEVAKEGSLPSSILVRAQPLAVVKLHGGTHSLRTDHQELDEALPITALHQLRQYLKADEGQSIAARSSSALLVVIGYSGSDRRVMDIITDHASNWHPSDPPNVVWISRRGTCHKRLEYIVSTRGKGLANSPVITCAYRSGHLFLQELYKVLENQYAVSRTGYQTIVSVPRTLPLLSPQSYRGTAPPGDSRARRYSGGGWEGFLPPKNMTDSGYVVLCREGCGVGTSSTLHRLAQEFEATHEIIWIDACDLTTRAMLVTQMEEEFLRLDHGNVRLSRPLFLGDVDYLSQVMAECDRTDANATQIPHADNGSPTYDERLAVWWITRAMRRGNYVVAIDSLGEFATRHPAVPMDYYSDKAAMTQKYNVLRLLGEVSKSAKGFGRSVFLSAMTPMLNDPEPWRDIERQTAIACRDHARAHFYRVRAFETTAQQDNTDARANLAVSSVVTMLEEGDADQLAKGILYSIATIFRRPRSRVALRVGVSRFFDVIRDLQDENSNDIQSILCDACAKLTNDSEFDRVLALTCGEQDASQTDRRVTGGFPPMLAHLEGGFYWMHLESRNALFIRLTDQQLSIRGKSVRLFSRAIIGNLFDKVASFAIDDVYERSQDLSAFIEYAHYRFLSVHYLYELYRVAEVPERKADAQMQWQTRLIWYVGAIEGERDTLLARGKITPLMGQTKHLIRFLVRAEMEHQEDWDTRAFVRRIAARVLAVQANVLMLCGRQRHALLYRLWQIEILVGEASIEASRDAVLEWYPSNVAGQGKERRDSQAALLKYAEEMAAKLLEKIPSEPHKLVDHKANYKVDLLGCVDALSELCRLIADPIILDESVWRMLADTDHAGEDEAAYRKKCIEISERYLFHTLKALAGFSRDMHCESDPLVMRLQECRAFVSVRRIHNHLNQCTSKSRFEWLVDYEGLACCDTCDAAQHARLELEFEDTMNWLRHGASTPQGRIIESYLHTMRAVSHWYLAVDRDSARHSSQREFNRALAVLVRPGGPAEAATIALVLLVHAEIHLVQLRNSLAKWSRPRDANCASEAVNMYQEIERSRHEARDLLDQASEILNDSCLENKWRWFYYYLRGALGLHEVQFKYWSARSAVSNGVEYFRHLAKEEAEGSRNRLDLDEATSKLRFALRDVVSGLAICGRNSDRYDIMMRLLGRLDRLGEQVFAELGKGTEDRKWDTEANRYEFFISAARALRSAESGGPSAKTRGAVKRKEDKIADPSKVPPLPNADEEHQAEPPRESY